MVTGFLVHSTQLHIHASSCMPDTPTTPPPALTDSEREKKKRKGESRRPAPAVAKEVDAPRGGGV